MMTDYLASLREAFQFMKAHDRFLVVSHVNPDGDTTGSALAVALILERLGKTYTVVNEGATPEKFGFLPRFERIVDLSRQDVGESFAHVIAVDAADSRRMGNVDRLFAPDVQIVNIDHHPTNDRFGQINVIRTDAAATAQIVYQLMEAAGLEMDGEIAACIYTGLLTDTGGFRYSNTTPEVMEIAGKMLRYGVKPGEIAERCLETITQAHVRLLGRVLPSLTLIHDGLVASLKVTQSDLSETGAGPDDLSGLVNYGRNIEGVEVGLLFTETEPEVVKVGLRSRRQVDVGQIAKRFGGGGHARAAGCTLTGQMEEIERQVLAAVEEALGVNSHE